MELRLPAACILLCFVLLSLGGLNANSDNDKDPMTPEQRKDMQYKTFAGFLTSMLILRQGGVSEAHEMVPYVRNLTRGFIAVNNFIHKNQDKFHDKKAEEWQAQLDSNVHLNDELLRLSLRFGKISPRLAEKLNKAKTKKEKLYNATDAKIVGKINKAFLDLVGEKGVQTILNLNKDLGSTKLNTAVTPAAILPYQHFWNQPNLLFNAIIGMASNKIGILINPCLVSYQSFGLDLTVAGVNFQPTLLQVLPAAVKVAAVGINIQPALMTVAPSGAFISPSGVKILPFLLGVVPAGAWIVPTGVLVSPFGTYWGPQALHINPNGLLITNITHLVPGGFLGYPDSLFYQAFSKKGVVAQRRGAKVLQERARNASRAAKAGTPTSAPAATGTGSGAARASVPSAGVGPGAGVGPTGVIPEGKMSINSGGVYFENTFMYDAGPYLGPALPPGVSLAPVPSVRDPSEMVGPIPLPRPAGTS
eukprot:jgi/Botrbrau1/21258/Bobra.39_2s0050.1